MQLLEYFIDITIRSADAVSGLVSIERRADQTAGGLGRTGTAAGGLTKKFIGTAAAAFSLYKIFGTMKDGAIDVQNGMISVAKTTGMSREEMVGLKQDIRKLAADPAVGASIKQLFELGEVAGTAGIKGSRNIAKFTEVMAKLNSASGGKLQGEAGAKAILNILDAAGEGVDQIDRLASSVTQMGNDFKVNEAEIASSATRVANALRPYGASAADIVGLSTAFAELRLSPELAQTAISKTLSKISLAIANGGEDLKEFQKITGLSKKEIQELLKTDGAALFNKFAMGLSRAKKEGKDLTVVLDKVGLADQRTGDTLRGIGTSAERLQTILRSSRSAYEENIALNEEAAVAGKSWSNNMQAMGNAAGFLGDAIASTGLLSMLTKLIASVAAGVFVFTDFVTALDPVALGLAVLPALIALITAVLVPLIASLWALVAPLLIAAAPFILIGAAIYLVVAAFRNFGKIIEWFKEKWDRFGKLLLLNPVFWIPFLIVKMVAAIFRALGGMDGIKDKLAAVFRVIKSIVVNSPFGLLVRLIAWSVRKSISAMGGVDAITAKIRSFMGLVKTALMNSPFGLLFRMIKWAVDKATTVTDGLDGIDRAFDAFLSGVKGAIMNSPFGLLVKVMRWAIGKARAAASGLDSVEGKFASFFGVLKFLIMNSPFGLLFRFIRWSVGKAMEATGGLGGIATLLRRLFTPVRFLVENNPISLLAGFIKSVVPNVRTAVSGVVSVFTGMFEPLRAMVENNPLTWLAGIIQGAVPAVSNSLSNLLASFKEYLVGRLGPIFDWAGEKLDKLKRWFRSGVDKIKSITRSETQEVVTFGGRGLPPPPPPPGFAPQPASAGPTTVDQSTNIERIDVHALPGMNTEDVADEVVRKLDRQDRRVAIAATN